MDDSVLAEGGGPDEVIYRLSVDRKPRLAIADHHSPVGVDPQKVAHVALLGPAVSAFLALAGEHREDVVSRC